MIERIELISDVSPENSRVEFTVAQHEYMEGKYLEWQAVSGDDRHAIVKSINAHFFANKMFRKSDITELRAHEVSIFNFH